MLPNFMNDYNLSFLFVSSVGFLVCIYDFFFFFCGMESLPNKENIL